MIHGKPETAAVHANVRSGRRSVCVVLMGMLAVAPLGACVNVSAPDKPIVIELNINIRQDVIYKLAADAADTIEQNKDVF
ncbi:YnbE family lipoprotein [Novosphingobium colocasiae]|nr:YnbE family lipoprotein [Novosphingobium colocasiae]